ncbi:MAG: SUMF1/EgtB/PvdO family nonheme iron enzyme [Magnetococcales bacterium]|nr:SUMF1/EgtB/PvdO family nonheme iron enzyme [Magnetococcales bacterium]MBF0150078.1 SUMF1/EgtB/PvdO family nonheme iron enzyme [Magnetococcales bacterium]
MDHEERYIDWKEIGRGAFGSVCRVYDTLLKRHVAIKLLKPEHANNQQLVEALQREVIISRDLRHDCICPIHDVYRGTHGVGTVMDLIDGMELSKWQKTNQGRLLDTATQRLELFRKLCDALSVAHTGVSHGGIVHRDLKPDNIFLLKGDPTHPMIMDFGTAVVGTTVADALVAGTPKYMSPEQWNTPDSVDQRADLFSLGIIAYELFTNRVPPTSLRSILKTREPPKVDLATMDPPSRFCAACPVDLDRIILQLMAYRREDRPQSARDVWHALSNVTLRQGDLLTGRGWSNVAVRTKTVLLPGGTFHLGSAAQQPGSMDYERPRKRVQISSFRMTVYPVTVAEYRNFVQTTGYEVPPLLEDPLFGQDDQPVVGVSHVDAMAYARWVGGSLPSEAQWEYAAKGGKNTIYPWGDDLPTSLRANIGGVSSTPSPVGSCPAGVNPFGLHDMCGNVWEWCLDVWDPHYYGMLSVGSLDPVCQVGGGERVLRGGAFDSFASQGRCTARFHASSEQRHRAFGFRLVFPVQE